MNGPPRDDSPRDRREAGDVRDRRDAGDGDDERDSDRDPTRSEHDAGIGPRTPTSGDAARRQEDGVSEPDATPTGTETSSRVDDPLGDLLPRASVDSRWWYWIAAIPLYVVLGGLLAILFVGAFIFDLFLTGGLVTVFGAFIVLPILGLVGLVLTILFPIASYIDARAVAESEASWTPDPLLWGLAALATVVLSAFTLSVLQALYYLYKRHVAVGTP